MMYNNDEEAEMFQMQTAGKVLEKGFPRFLFIKEKKGIDLYSVKEMLS